jgi:hypothetical protein
LGRAAKNIITGQAWNDHSTDYSELDAEDQEITFSELPSAIAEDPESPTNHPPSAFSAQVILQVIQCDNLVF